jgi:GNAT superfamily N-acetyltransferase
MPPSGSRAGVQVRTLQAEDVPAFLDLVDALADYEHLPRPTAEARERLARDATSNPPRFNVLLAEVEGAVAGYAMFFWTYSSFLARPTLYLEDLFVRPDARRRGAGAALFDACAAEAVRQGCGRMEWQVLDWNTPSIEFYQRKGARRLGEWLPFRLDGDALLAFGAG